MDNDLLKNFGMTNTEIKVYLEIGKNGETKIGPIIQRTGLHRGTVYNSLTSLVDKGFISFSDKENIRYYKVSGEKIFKQILEDKEKEIIEEKSSISNIFNSFVLADKKETDFNVYFGVNSFKNLFLDIFESCKKDKSEYLFLGMGGEMLDAVGEGFYKYTQQLKKKENLKYRGILAKESINHAYKKNIYGNTRYISTPVFSPINLWIYGDTALLVLFKTDPLTIIKIKSRPLADGFRNYFEVLWSSSVHEQKILHSRHVINFNELIEFAQESLDIMDICGMEPLHEGRAKILELLKKGKKVKVLISNPKSKNFRNRVFLEERFIKNIGESRILYELKSAIANLKDIRARLRGKGNLEVRFFDEKPDYTIIILDSKKILYNRYGNKRGEYGASHKTLLLDKEIDKEFKVAKNTFEKYWKSAKTLKI
ncbi:MAG: helix-turn-helix domain-containing protein [Nanoarchaeota archaeon]|nr:helix-turn-helix domain-containing protein [Nanoarchaeota archaeon]